MISSDFTKKTPKKEIDTKKRKKSKRFLGLSYKKRKCLKIAGLVVALLIVASLSVYGFSLYRALQNWDKSTMFIVEEEEQLNQVPTITVNGREYMRNENMVSILLIGLDEETVNGEFNKQCDAVAVVAVDTSTNTMKIISIPRDTMMPIVRKDANGKFYDETQAQVALAHSYGDDDMDSLELVRRSVSNFLYGVAIQDAVSFQISGVPLANDLVGGVTVNLLEDFSAAGASYTKLFPNAKIGDEIHLNGQQAHAYVRYRDTAQLNSSMDRLKRQIQYIKAYFKAAKQKFKENPTFPITVYTQLSQYITSTLNLQEVAYLAGQVLSTDITDDTIVSVKGELIMGEKYAEFYPNEDEVLQLVLDVFYIEKLDEATTQTIG